MTRQGVNTLPMLIALERTSNAESLHQQIYHALRKVILEGRLPMGGRLPGSRVLAEDLGVSRATILTAYDRLEADGYVGGRSGSGTRILPIPSAPPRELSSPTARGDRPASDGPASDTTLSALGAKMIAASDTSSPVGRTRAHTPFALAVPALDAFPVLTWARLTAHRWRKTPRLMLCPDDGPGYGPLREAIAEYVVAGRAVRCSPEQIVITSGAQQAIDLLSRLLLNPGDDVWVEEYGYQPAHAIFAGVGARPITVPVDDEGLDVERARQLGPHARLAFVTPACAPPFSVSMSKRRRLALLEWAEQTGGWIIEDDYNGELYYEGTPSTALQGLDHPGARRVIYLRSFSRTLFPALRLAYVVLPVELLDAFTRARFLSDRHSPIAEQAVLTDFITAGHFARHTRNMRKLYAERQRIFLELADRELGELLRFRPAPANIRLVGFLPPGVCDQQVARHAAERDIVVEPLSRAQGTLSGLQGLVLGYAPFQPAQIRQAMGGLAEAIRAVLRS